MLKRILKTFIFGVALTVAVAFSAALTGCNVETDHPEVTITVKFNDTTYNLNYKLYRNMYPVTVKHFIELADSGFYNNMVIHNYTTASDWTTGGYSYDADDYIAAVSGSYLSDYLGKQDKEDEYYDLFSSGKLTASVFKTQSATLEDALPTIRGEFDANDHTINNGALTASFGTLKMYYYDKTTKQRVYVKPNSTQLVERNYKYNCATSLFMMQVGSSSSYTSSDYCIFATLKNESRLETLLDDISEYISDNYGGSPSSFTVSTSVSVDNNDDFSTEVADKGISTVFSLPKTAIVITKVKVTKY